MTDAVLAGPRSAVASRSHFATRQIDWSGYALIAFFGAPFLIFNIGPVLFGIYVGFTEWGIFGAPRWVGLENYRVALADPWVALAFKNILWYAAIIVPGVT